jgi:hypothetical protein
MQQRTCLVAQLAMLACEAAAAASSRWVQQHVQQLRRSQHETKEHVAGFTYACCCMHLREQRGLLHSVHALSKLSSSAHVQQRPCWSLILSIRDHQYYSKAAHRCVILLADVSARRLSLLCVLRTWPAT